MKTALALSVGAALILAAAGARAQSSDRDIRRDYQRLGPNEPPQAGAPKDFEFALTMPLLWTNNAVSTVGDINVPPSQKADVHFNPDALMKWSHQFSAVKLSASADASVDRFFHETDQDEDTLFGSLKLSFTNGRSDLFVPYIAYDVTADLRPDFGPSDDVLHNFSAGASSGIGFDAAGARIPLRDATKPGNWSLALDVSSGRRLADPHDFENTFINAVADIDYVLSSTWTVGFTPKFRVRWYDNFEGAFRRDVRLTGILRAAWRPTWLTQLVRSAEVDFSVSFLRNYSTVPDERFSQWEGGPSLVLAWKF